MKALDGIFLFSNKKKIILIIIAIVLFVCFPEVNSDEKINNYGLPQILKRMHFVIYHDDRRAANNISWKAEYYYKRIIRHFNVPGFRPWTDNKKCTIYLFKVRDDFIKNAKAPLWSAGLARYNSPRLYIYEDSPNLIEGTLPHELTHLIFAEFMDRQKIPSWLNEGMAQYEEEKWDKGYSYCQKKDHQDNRR